MSYELNVNATTTGQPQLTALDAATAKLAGTTKGLDNALYGAGAAQEKFTLGTQKLAIETAKIEQLSIKYRIAVLEETAAHRAAAEATEVHSAATGRFTGQTMQARAAVQALNGSFGTMAAGRWLGQLQGMGPLIKGLFPIIGGIALLSVLDKLVEKTEDWANAHNPVLQAQQASLSILKQEGEEYDKLAGKVRELNREALKRRPGGAALVDRIDAADAKRAAREEDQDRIDKLQGLRTSLSRFQRFPSAITQGDVSLDARIKAVLNRQDDEKFKTGLEGLAEGKLPTAGQFGAAHELDLLLDQALATARKQQEKDLAQAREKKADADKLATRANRIEDNRVAELEKRSRETYATSLFGDEPTPQRRLATSNARIELERTDALRRDREAAKAEGIRANPNAINAAFDLQKTAAFITFLDQSTKALEKFEKELSKEFPNALDAYSRKPGDFREQYYDMTGHLREGGDARKNFDLFGLPSIPSAPAGYTTPAQQLRDAQDNERRGISRLQLQNRLSDASAAERAGSTASARLGYANDEFAARIREANLKGLDAEKARLDAVDELKQKKFDIEMERENALLEITLRQKEEARSFSGSLFDALKSRSTNQFFKSFAVGQEKAVFENLAGPIVKGATNLLGGAGASIPKIGGIDLFRGTVLDSANAAPERTAQNTALIVTNTLNAVTELKALRTASTGQTGDASAVVPPDIFNSSTGSFNLSGINGGLLGTGIGTGALGAGTAAAGLSKLFAAGSSSPFSQVLSGIGGGGSDPLRAIATGFSTSKGADGGLMDTQLTSAQRVGVAAGTAAMLAGAGMTIAKGLSEGGAGGFLQAASGVLGAASLIPGAAVFTAPAALLTGVLSSIISTGPQQRAKDLFNEISKAQYLAPTALNVTQGRNGTYEDFGARGELRTSNMLALPTVSEPYITSRVVNGQRTYYDAPGQATAPYTGGAFGTGVTPVSNAGGTTNNFYGPISAMDTESFHNFLQKPGNSMAVGESVANHLQSHEGRLSNAIRFVASP